MITFKEFILTEDVFARGDELLAAVNQDSTRRASTETQISTNLRPLGHLTYQTHGQDVYYAFSYKPSDKPGGSTDLLKSLKGHGPFKLLPERRVRFIDEVSMHIADQFKKMKLKPDVVVTPQSSSSLLTDFANELADRLGVSARKVGAFKKATITDIPQDYEEALKVIQVKYLDLAYLEQKFKGDEQQLEKIKRELSQKILSSIKKHGNIAAKSFPKMYGKFIKNIMVHELDDEYSLIDKEVMVVDDILSSGMTMNSLFQAVNDLGAKRVYGCTLFARTSSTH